MTQAFSLTAAGTKPAEGMYAYMPNKPHIHNAEFYSGTSTDTVTAGSFVKLYGSSTSTTRPVVAAAAVTDVPYGMVVYDALNNVHGVGDLVALATTGDSVFMVAAGAIAVGAKLQFNASTRKVDDSTTATYAYIGVAETAAAAAGDLIQVKLDFTLGTQAAG
jgi:hypothetical protein